MNHNYCGLADCVRLMQDNAHPFIMAMNDFLIESGNRANRPTLLNNLMSSKYEEDIKTMAELADNRKLNPHIIQFDG